MSDIVLNTSGDIALSTKIHLVKAMGYFSSHVWMWELDYKESWGPKNWWFWTVVLEKTLESPLDCKEIQSVHPEGNQSWILIGRTDAEAETPIFGHLMWRANSLKKTLMLEKIQGRRRRGWLQRMRWLDGIMTQWIWVSASSRRWWRTGKPGVLQSMRSQRVGHDWRLNINNIRSYYHLLYCFVFVGFSLFFFFGISCLGS